MSASVNEMFAETQAMRQAVNLVNATPADKFAIFLNRIIQRLHQKDNIFTEQECAQLKKVLALESDTDLQITIDACSYIFEQSAYFSASVDTLTENLKRIKIDEAKQQAFEAVWETEGLGYVTKLRNKPLGAPSELTDVAWRLQLEMSQTGLTRVYKPAVLFKLELNDGQENVTFECSHKELLALYDKLEVVQSQL